MMNCLDAAPKPDPAWRPIALIEISPAVVVRLRDRVAKADRLSLRPVRISKLAFRPRYVARYSRTALPH